MSAALELIETVKANGGQMRVEGDSLVIAPGSAAMSIVDALRQHKREIIWLLENSKTIPVDNPEAWREDFARWMTERCIHRKGNDDAGGVGCLLLDFAEWAIQSDSVPCDRRTFEALLTDAGFRVVDGLALGLVFKDDVEYGCPL